MMENMENISVGNMIPQGFYEVQIDYWELLCYFWVDFYHELHQASCAKEAMEWHQTAMERGEAFVTFNCGTS